MGNILITLNNGDYSLALLFLIGLPLVAAPAVYFAGRLFNVARWAALIAIGYYLGVWLDKKAGTHWIGFAGFVLGCYAGFRALFKAAKCFDELGESQNAEKMRRKLAQDYPDSTYGK